jgi:hypothetical protein
VPDEVKQIQAQLSESARKEFSRIVDNFGRVLDDDRWPPLPEYLDLAAGLTFSFPTAERLRSQIRRHASKAARKIGRPINANTLSVREYYGLKNLRELQSHYQQLADFLKKADRDDLLLGLGNALHYAFWLGQQCPPEERTVKAGKGKRRIERHQRLAIMGPLVEAAREAPELKSKKAPSIAKHIRPALEKELKARKMAVVKPDTIRTDVEDIIAGRV